MVLPCSRPASDSACTAAASVSWRRWATSLRTNTRCERTSRSRSLGPKTMVPTWKPPSVTRPMIASVCSSVVDTRLSTTSNGTPSTTTRDWRLAGGWTAQQPQSRRRPGGVTVDHVQLPETLQVFITTGAEDTLLHVAVPSTEALRDFVLDSLTKRREVAGVRTEVVFDHEHQHVTLPASP